MASVFTKIVQGEIPSHKVMEDENFYAFLDIQPIVPGHTLVIPKKEVDYIYDLEDHTLSGLHIFAKKVANTLKKTFPCERISVIVAGFEVPHAHIHLIPSNTMEDLNFTNRTTPSQEQLANVAKKIKEQL